MTTEERDPSAPDQPDAAPDQPGDVRKVNIVQLIATETGMAYFDALQARDRRDGIKIDGESYDGPIEIPRADIEGKEVQVSVPPRQFVFRVQKEDD